MMIVFTIFLAMPASLIDRCVGFPFESMFGLWIIDPSGELDGYPEFDVSLTVKVVSRGIVSTF